MGLFGGNDETVRTTFAAKDDMTPVVRGIRNTMDNFKRDAKTGFGLAAGISVFGVAQQAFGMVTDVLMDGAKAAIEDEKAQAQLVATLRANVGGWEAHTGAIEDAIEAGQNLAFTDDDIRASMGRLVPFTKDVSEAIRLNALAMDLARARGMRLEEAATLVAKAYSGQVTALRRAGIAIGDAKTSTQALAALQRQVSGQAQTYAETTEGSFASLQVQLDEIVEEIGYELLPTMKEFAEFAKTDLVPAVKEAVSHLKDAVDVMSLLGAVATMDPQVIGKVIDWLTKTDEAAQDLTRTLTVPPPDALPQFFGRIEDAVPPAVRAISDLGSSVMTLPETFRTAVVDMKATVEDGKAAIVEQFRDLAWQSKHPFAEASYERWLERKQQRAMRLMNRAAAQGKPGIVAQYRTLVDEIGAELVTLPTFAAEIQQQVAAVMSSIRTTVSGAIGYLFNLEDGYAESAEAVPDRPRKRKKRKHHKGRAAGGDVSPDTIQRVGERGPEWIVTGRRGASVIPESGRRGDIVLQIDGRVLMRWVDGQLGRRIAMGG